MKWTPCLLGSLAVVTFAACGGQRRNNETGTASGAGSDTAVSATDTAAGGGMSGGMSTDTTAGGARMHPDQTSPGARTSETTGMRSGTRDSAKGNQTKSGVTNTETGKSTLGKGVTKTRPDQGQPVTSKGDTVSAGADTSASNR